eukprot:TRINITY_DN4074_c4_g1_i1.p1 TRINITY_DN4074_c4_g1~~TRINITY_DN4074_c4_g1_i1.p1  ORF type:complete len:169 (+),score=36.01 TRINITY_DN4074_c4_g1_i1:81-587(+)
MQLSRWVVCVAILLLCLVNVDECRLASKSVQDLDDRHLAEDEEVNDDDNGEEREDMEEREDDEDEDEDDIDDIDAGLVQTQASRRFIFEKAAYDAVSKNYTAARIKLRSYEKKHPGMCGPEPPGRATEKNIRRVKFDVCIVEMKRLFKEALKYQKLKKEWWKKLSKLR